MEQYKQPDSKGTKRLSHLNELYYLEGWSTGAGLSSLGTLMASRPDVLMNSAPCPSEVDMVFGKDDSKAASVERQIGAKQVGAKRSEGNSESCKFEETAVKRR